MCESGQVEILEHFRGEIITQKTILGSSDASTRACPAAYVRDEMPLKQFDANEFKAAKEVMQSAGCYTTKRLWRKMKWKPVMRQLSTHTGTQMLFLIIDGRYRKQQSACCSHSAAFYYFITPLVEESESIKVPVFLFGCG